VASRSTKPIRRLRQWCGGPDGLTHLRSLDVVDKTMSVSRPLDGGSVLS